MFKTRSSPLLPLDARGRPMSVRAFVSSKRARALVFLAFTLSACVFFLGLSPQSLTRIRESTIQVDPDEELPEQTYLPPAPTTIEHEVQVERPPAPAPPKTTAPPAPQVVDNTWALRAEQVREAFIRGYSVYHEHAFPHDEVLPKTYGYTDKLGGWGATAVDSLDTMLLMGLHDLFNATKPFVASLTFDEDRPVQFFEMVIRYLGGLLSVYAMTEDPLYLARADDLGRHLIGVFDTKTGLPTINVNPKTGLGWGGWSGSHAMLAEMASCQMEYRYLAHLTGRPEYVRAVDRVTHYMRKNLKEFDGLYAAKFMIDSGMVLDQTYSVAAMADSAYEYMLKEWLATGKKEQKYLDMYLESTNAILSNLLYLSPTRNLLYLVDARGSSLRPDHQLQHLGCFFAGLLALGAHTIPPAAFSAHSFSLEHHMWAARGLGHTCWLTYAETATGLGPERVQFTMRGSKRWADVMWKWEEGGRVGEVPGLNDQGQAVKFVDKELDLDQGEGGVKRDYFHSDQRYLLRPEVIESMYMLWRTTNDTRWRERGWAMFEAIEQHARTNDSYASIFDVNIVPAVPMNDLPSFFFAETLKYAFLIASTEELVPLDKWVFNTEAHPLPVYEWSEWEMEWFNLTRPFDDGDYESSRGSATPESKSVPDQTHGAAAPPPQVRPGAMRGSGKAPINVEAGGNTQGKDWEADRDHGALDLDVDLEDAKVEANVQPGKGHPVQRDAP